MKRMPAAIALALLLHAALFLIGFDWFPDASVPPSISRFVTVTMSYRQKAVKAEPVTEKEEVVGQETLEPKRIETPKPKQKPLPEKSLAKPLKSPASKPEEPRAAGDDKISDATRSTKQSAADTGLVREAIPLYKINPPPRYPRTARRRGIQGTVVLSVYVDRQGRVSNLWVFESSGYRVLDNAALDSVKKWSFEPGRKGRATVAMWVNVQVRFELQ